MTATFTMQGIDRLRAHPLAEGGTEVSFRSTNEGMYHQLYVNGRLADWCEEPSHRSFLLPELPDHVRKALEEVIDHLCDDELKHLRAGVRENPGSFFGNHIFVHLGLRGWVVEFSLREDWDSPRVILRPPLSPPPGQANPSCFGPASLAAGRRLFDKVPVIRDAC